MKDKEYAKEFKIKNFDYVTFSGTFTTRNDKNLISYSNLICFDFDGLENVEETKKNLCNDPYFDTQLLFVSPSGNGLKWVIHNPLHQSGHQDFFNAVANYLLTTYSLKVDMSGKDISRACFLPHDPNCVYNLTRDNKLEFDYQKWLLPAENKSHAYVKSVVTGNNCEIEALTLRVERMMVDIAPSYQEWRDLGFALADALREEGRSYFHRLSCFYPNYSYEEADKQYDKCLASKGHGITKKTIFYLAQRNGVPILNLDYEHNMGNTDSTEMTDIKILPTFSDKITGKVPVILQKIIEKASDCKNADLLLVGAITAMSSCLPNLYVVYGKKKNYSNLFSFVTAKASAGKGDLDLVRNIVKKIHEQLKEQYASEMEDYKRQRRQYENNSDPDALEPKEPKRKMLMIPANSSSTAFYEILSNNDGVGLLFETEGDTLTYAFKKDYGDYSDGFRKIYHHETISYMRRQNKEHVEIESPRLSAVLSGTPRQVKSLIEDPENGLFSRFVFYHYNLDLVWKDVFANDDAPLDEFFDEIGEEFFQLYELLKNAVPIKFELLTSQKEKFNKYFDEMQLICFRQYGEDMIPTVRRLGLVTVRIAMIFTALRILEDGVISTHITCSDEDFSSAMIMASVLIEHTIKVFKTLKFDKNVASFSNETVKNFYVALPEQFDRKTYLEVADNIGVNPRTAEEYVADFVKKKIVFREKQNCYRKPSQNTLDGDS